MTDPILFKKYANRRLYNLSESKYVTLEDMSKLISEGHEIKVIDAKTKADVTAFILTQINLEQAKKKKHTVTGAVSALYHQKWGEYNAPLF